MEHELKASTVSEDRIEAACRIYNSVLLNQPEDQRNQPAAMRAVLAALTPKSVDTASAEGWTDEQRTELAKRFHDAMVWAAQQGGQPQRWQNGNSTAEGYARREARDALEALASTPSSDRSVGDDVRKRAAKWLRECHSWLMQGDLDMVCPMETDPLDLAEELEALGGTGE